jgi:hypothetical protein
MALHGAKLKVQTYDRMFDQVECLRDIIRDGSLDAVRTIRRHWHDFSFRRPTQNWHTDPDYQIRIMRNNGQTGWDAGSRMHERIVGVSNVYRPDHTQGPFFDHLHLFFKRMEVAQRGHDLAIYNAINEGREPPLDRGAD